MKVGPPRHIKVGVGVRRKESSADGAQQGQPALKVKYKLEPYIK